MTINRLAKAVVRVNGIWKFVYGERKCDDMFVYLNNGRMEIACKGNFKTLNSVKSEGECSWEAIRLNLYYLETR